MTHTQVSKLVKLGIAEGVAQDLVAGGLGTPKEIRKASKTKLNKIVGYGAKSKSVEDRFKKE